MGPFSGSLAFTKARAKYRSVLLYMTSAETGTVMEASVVRIQLG
jgi:hypothetical protein